MEVTAENIEQGTILYLNGRFDANVSAMVVEHIDKAADASAPNAIVNMAEVPFIDSSGLTVLVRGLKRCRQRGGDLVLCNLQQPVQIIFELTSMDRAFKIFTDEAAARAALSQ